MADFTPKRVSEAEIFTVDFSSLLADGETITSAVWTNSVSYGTDPSPSSMISGSETISGSTVSQLIVGGVANVRYEPICTAHTSLGQILILPDVRKGRLLVRAD